MSRAKPLIERVMRRVDKTGTCWLWTGPVDRDGYGTISIVKEDGRHGGRRTHRVVYEHFKGEIPEGLQLDHLCRVPSCCNPDHLEPVTALENIRRSAAPAMLASLLGRCHRGHVLVPCDDPPRRHERCRECSRVDSLANGREKRNVVFNAMEKESKEMAEDPRVDMIVALCANYHSERRPIEAVNYTTRNGRRKAAREILRILDEATSNSAPSRLEVRR